MAGAVILTGAVSAEPVEGRAAAKELFSPRGVDVRPAETLSAGDAALIDRMVELQPQTFRYYGAIAYSPDEGLAAEPIRASGLHHSLKAAEDAAVTACNAARAPGSRPCEVAAVVVPKRYEARALELSQDATAAFRGRYRKERGEKAMAISPLTGEFAIRTGAGAAANAIAACNLAARSKGAEDCTVVIKN